jgi:hypothetical protein
VYTKKANAALSESRRSADKGKSEDDQFRIQATNLMFEVGLAAGLRDNDEHRAEMESCLLSDDYSSVRAYVIQLTEAPPVMCSGGIFPERSYSGQVLHRLADPTERGNLLTISSFSDETYGYVVLSWLRGSDETCIPFVESLETVDDAALSGALLRLFFEYLENIFIKPTWWEGLSDAQREGLNSRMWSIIEHFSGTKESGDVTDDGLHFKPWSIVSRRRVGCYGSNEAMQPTGEDASG